MKDAKRTARFLEHIRRTRAKPIGFLANERRREREKFVTEERGNLLRTSLPVPGPERIP